MQSSQVRILEKFGVSSVVMPYFGYAHQSFLLLSRLSKGSRAMLDDFYREIVNWLFKWNMMISIDDHNSKELFLPSDLFKFKIDLNNESILQEFIELIRMRHQHKGHYFNAHYMHERLKFCCLLIRLDLIKELAPDFDILNSIKLTDENNWTSTESDWNSCRIIDQFMIKDLKDFIVDKTHFILPQYFIEASKPFESELCWKPFYKLFFLNLTSNSYRITLCISPHKIEEILVISIFHFFNYFFRKRFKYNLRKFIKKIVKLTTQTLFDFRLMRLTIFLLIDSIMFMQNYISNPFKQNRFICLVLKSLNLLALFLIDFLLLYTSEVCCIFWLVLLFVGFPGRYDSIK